MATTSAHTLAMSPTTSTVLPPQPGTTCDAPGTLVEGRPAGEDIAFVDADHGWLVRDAAIYVTIDGGVTWTHQATCPNTSLSAVDFVDVMHGWAVGFAFPCCAYTHETQGPGAIVATTDGGRTWRRQEAPRGDFLAAAFVDTDHGWAVGNGGVIAATSDGGEHWVSQADSHSGKTSEGVDFIDANRGWIVSPDSTALSTSDGGATWTTQRIDGSPSGVHFFDTAHGWIVGSELILSTSNGGATWRRYAGPLNGWHINRVQFVDDRQGWAVGIDHTDEPGSPTGDLVLATSDGGTTWTRQSGPSGVGLFSLSFVSASRGWVTGRYGGTWRTIDGGKTWS
jgi:photosystem II stability/assembly factor-like uncharacterized protein